MNDLLSLEECYDILSEIRYRPNWAADLVSDGYVGFLLQLKVDTFDTYNGHPTFFRSGAPITAGHRQSRNAFINRVHKAIADAEAHERDEWFMVGDARPFDPHLNDPPRPASRWQPRSHPSTAPAQLLVIDKWPGN